MTQIIKKLKQVLIEIDIKSDPWGITMGAFFQVAAHTYELGDCPAEWGFRLGCAGNYIDPEDSLTEFLKDFNYNELVEMGNFLHKLTNLLKLKGLDY